MKIDGQHYRTIWRGAGDWVEIIDQTRLPHEFAILKIDHVDSAATAIRTMQVRGAPLIGATGAYGLALALAVNPGQAVLADAYRRLLETRPTAINLRWALDRMQTLLTPLAEDRRAAAAWVEAAAIADE